MKNIHCDGIIDSTEEDEQEPSEEEEEPTDENELTFREYRYLIGGQNGALPAFSKFQVKVVFRSISSGYLYHYAFLIVFSLVVIFGIILARVL